MSPDDPGAARTATRAQASFAMQEPEGLRRYREVRARSLKLAEPLSSEDMTAQSMPDASPVKWHLAHTTWFFETFILTPLSGAEPFDPAYGVLFNSYYEAIGTRTPRPLRGRMTRPGVKGVLAYRAHVDQAMERLISLGLDDASTALLTLGLAHEEQHQELILTDVLHLLSLNPLSPAYVREASALQPSAPSRLTWTDHPGGLIDVGADSAGFAFDNERPRHQALLQPHRLADRLVTNTEWLDFMEEGGYRRPELWLSDGWAMVCGEGWEAPLHWRRDPAGGWRCFGLQGLQPLDLHAPVAHVSHYEADAYARWAGGRLPTEFEWEAHATRAGVSPADGALRAKAARGEGPRGFGGAVWQWTSSAYLPYPAFAAAPGAVGEYNGKFMSGQMVLRGSSFATPPGHERVSYRNFFPAAARWQFTGLRLAQDRLPPIVEKGDLVSDALKGLRRARKTLPSKHLYDARGSELFEEITGLAEYYPTRTERALLAGAADEIASEVTRAGAGQGVLVEFGSGASVKTRLLLDALPNLTAYAPIDISPSALAGAAQALRADYPALAVHPVEADFTRAPSLPRAVDGLPRVGFFPGSTIGNFSPEEAEIFLANARDGLGEGALFLVGVDLVKDAETLRRAYDDAEGVTAAFNLNLLERLNREAGATFDVSAFRHRAVWSPAESRMEMRLESLKDQDVTVAGERIRFVKGETIHTENSYKYRPEAFAEMALRAGWTTLASWRSADPYGFLLTLLRA